jgi:hypothetical protein
LPLNEDDSNEKLAYKMAKAQINMSTSICSEKFLLISRQTPQKRGSPYRSP